MDVKMNQPNQLTAEQLAKLEQVVRDAIPNDESREHSEYSDEFVDCFYCRNTGTKGRCKVGRPLQLADVLIAARQGKDHVLACDARGLIWKSRGDGKTWNWFPVKKGDKYLYFDLTANYHQQSPDFYSFLHSLLIHE